MSLKRWAVVAIIAVFAVIRLVMAQAVAADKSMGDVQEELHLSNHNVESTAFCLQTMQLLSRTALLPGRPQSTPSQHLVNN